MNAVSIDREDKDRISVKMLQPEKFRGMISGKDLWNQGKGSNEVVEFVPQQVDEKSEKMISIVESKTTGTIKAILMGNFFFSFLLSLSLSSMIGALNAM